ncbi:MAG: hypothetical protein ABIK15_00425 [Pseudomonadota bacterium]
MVFFEGSDARPSFSAWRMQRYSLINRQELAKLLGIKDDGPLIESQTPYSPLFTPEKHALSLENGYFWDIDYSNST